MLYEFNNVEIKLNKLIDNQLIQTLQTPFISQKQQYFTVIQQLKTKNLVYTLFSEAKDL